MLALAQASGTTRASLPRSQHASLPGLPVRRPMTRGARRTPMRSMAQPAFETANLLQAALPAVLRTLPSFILASVALYATTNYIQYNQIRRRIEETRNRATKSDSARQEKLKRLGLGQAPKEGEGGKDVKE